MKLKQRVITTGALFLVMSTLFIIGTHLGWRSESAVNAPDPVPPPTTDQRRRPEENEVLANRAFGAGPRDRHADPRIINGPRVPPRAPIPDLKSELERLGPRRREDLLRAWRNRTAGMDGRTDEFPFDGRVPPQEMSRELLARLDEVRMGRNAALEKPDIPVVNEGVGDNRPQRVPEVNRQVPVEAQLKDAGDRLNRANGEVPEVMAGSNPWEIWRRWVHEDRLYPEGMFRSERMNHILNSMATEQITSMGVGYKGTQLKASVMLGKQKAVFKPKW